MPEGRRIKKSSAVRTFTGRDLDPLNPNPEDIDIQDIARSLSMQCRWNGHCNQFYSVADHCYRVSWLLDDDQDMALWALLHDAAEAYTADVPLPIKRHMGCYEEVEDKLLGIIMEKYNLPAEEPEEVYKADMIILATEARDLMGDDTLGVPGFWPLNTVISPNTIETARDLFLDRFYQLMERRGFMKAYMGAFAKKDGTLREMKFLRLNEVSEEFLREKIKGEYKPRSLPQGMETVWDLEAEGFRTFNHETATYMEEFFLDNTDE